jgi:sulfite exporter TauE/SafE
MNWVILGFVVVGIILILVGYGVGSKAQMEDYSFILPMLMGVICIAIAFLLWAGRWFWHAAEPWLQIALAFIRGL